jgi:Transposase DDE domain
VITNVPARLASFDEILILLRLRWQIERLFRRWKEHGSIDEWRSKKPWRILTEVYGKLAAMVIQQWLIHEGCWQDPYRSLVKAAQVVRREANLIMRALYQGGVGEVIEEIVGYMRSGCQTQKRQQAPSTAQFLMGEPHRWPVRQELAARLPLTSCVWGSRLAPTRFPLPLLPNTPPLAPQLPTAELPTTCNSSAVSPSGQELVRIQRINIQTLNRLTRRIKNIARTQHKCGVAMPSRSILHTPFMPTISITRA